MNRVPSRVIVYYPRGLRSGGPEALHQLVATLRQLGTEAYLTPTPHTRDTPRAMEYEHYDAPEIGGVVDAEDVGVVVPEVHLEGLRGLRNAQGYCWWLSIDNAPAFQWRLGNRHPSAARDLYRRLRALGRVREIRAMTSAGTHHLTQSHYAWGFLNARFGIIGSMVSDYVTHDGGQERLRPRANPIPVVAFNPAKGAALVEALRSDKRIDVQWLPLVNKTRQQVGDALSSCDVYIDLGIHPGKDRLPREAALAGALTLVARRGAAAFAADVPIPLDHKVQCDGGLVSNAADTLLRVLPHLQAEVPRQDFYRAVIRGERATFARQVRDVFLEGRLGIDLDIPGVVLPDTS